MSLSIAVYSVTKYSTATGCVSLHHAHPKSLVPPVTALVDVNLLLSTLKTTDTQLGEWVNVIGYLELSNEASTSRQQQRGVEGAHKRRVYGVQAIMLWSAGALRIAEYERVLEERKRLEVQGIETKEVVG